PQRVEQDGRYRGHARDAVDSTVFRDEEPEPGAEDEEAQGAPDEERVAVAQGEAAEKLGVRDARVGRAQEHAQAHETRRGEEEACGLQRPPVIEEDAPPPVSSRLRL